MAQIRKGLRSLWDDSERREGAHKIVDSLIHGELERAQGLTEMIEGKWDLRGFDFGMRSEDVPFQRFTPTGVSEPIHRAPWGNCNHYADLTLEDFDFSMSLFSNSSWEDCTFRDCVFHRSDLLYSHFRGCTFHRVRFVECWIENAGLGLSNQKNLGLFSEVEFKKGVFSRVVFGFPRFERCRFDTNINTTDFYGSQLSDCTFKGNLDKVHFWARAEPGWRGTDITITDPPPNPMKGIDFSKARFKEVTFNDCIDLSDCRLPDEGGVFLVVNSTKVFDEAARLMEQGWTYPDKDVAIDIAMANSRRKKDCTKDHFIINPYTLKQLGEEFAEHYIYFIKEAMKRC